MSIFSSNQFKKNFKFLNKSKLFDQEWYISEYKLPRSINALEHFIKRGWKSGFNPSVYFDTNWYLQTNTDVKSAGICPLTHFLRFGIHENRSTSPFFDPTKMTHRARAALNETHPLLAYITNHDLFKKDAVNLFDIDFYQSAAAVQGVSIDGDPFKHFMHNGWRLGLDPHPLFSVSYYINSNPDVKLAGINPLAHYASAGGAELRRPHPQFDCEHYVRQIADWSKQQGYTPLQHFLDVGVHIGANPNSDFDVNYYLRVNHDVRDDGINPFVHFIVHGQKEGRPHQDPSRKRRTREQGLSAAESATLGTSLRSPTTPISVVIPTYNRVQVLAETLACCFSLGSKPEIEFIIINDGSTDGTADFLNDLKGRMSNVEVIHTSNGGPGSARNLGVARARHDVVLFMGDDIRPAGPDFFNAHSDFHERRNSLGEAVVGKTIWPNGRSLDVGPVMRHIQGRGGEQFGFADLTPYEWIDWRFFYTSNISMKKAAVKDWSQDGFSDHFKLYGFEDIELAYRLSKGNNGLRIFYDPLSVGEHIHPYNFEQFVQRQLNTGRMARTFLDIHPDAAEALGLTTILLSLSDENHDKSKDMSDILAIFEGIRGWTNYLERHLFLGNSGFHDDLMSAFFEYSFYVGFINAARSPTENTGAALQAAFNTFLTRMRRSLRTEVTSHEHIFPLVP
ncbi:glycosyltransferase family 2 protein [Ensifer sp. ENS03]|uniref:glycosyltransferase n=1 Tax=Ensifer sp. ENS03 TaxID=2769283 RepID=UPI00177F20A4|nr:glycosyltransferase [Ensifer sp. ENS03]MBD9559605.1 glycosyltransferase family 2 protein [Ensifer sp. ENS03]